MVEMSRRHAVEAFQLCQSDKLNKKCTLLVAILLQIRGKKQTKQICESFYVKNRVIKSL